MSDQNPQSGASVERSVLDELQANQKMKIAEVASSLDLPHQAAREAMNSLSQKNLVISTPGFEYEPTEASTQNRD